MTSLRKFSIRRIAILLAFLSTFQALTPAIVSAAQQQTVVLGSELLVAESEELPVVLKAAKKNAKIKKLVVKQVKKIGRGKPIKASKLKKCFRVYAILKNGKKKLITNYTCNKTGKIAPKKGNLTLTFKYADKKVSIKVKFKKASTPSATFAPVATATPNATSTPVETATPNATSTPVETATPNATSTPAVTATPNATKNPNNTTIIINGGGGSSSGNGNSSTSASPSPSASAEPSASPSAEPSESPSAEPSESPSAEPSESPSAEPSESPSAEPSESPSAEPSESPSAEPSESPSAEPSESPSAEPSESPSAEPSESPSAEPSASPSAEPSASPSAEPSASPSAEPSASPSATPKYKVEIEREGKGKIFIDGEEVEFYNGKATIERVAGKYEFETHAADGYKTSSWLVNGSVMTDSKVTVAIIKDSIMKVVFIEEDVFVTVNYKYNGITLKSEAVLSGESGTEPPKPSTIKDKIFDGWLLDGVIYKNVDELMQAISKATSEKRDIDIEAVYADVEIYYNVVTENGPVLVDPDSGEPLEVNTFLAGDKIKIVTPEYDDNGWKLAYIVDKDNNIVTYDSEYITFINSNLYFKAIYMEEEVPKEPIVGFRGDKYELNPDSGRILFLTTIDVPDEFAVLEWGCLVSTKSDELSYPDSYSVKETNPSVQNSTYADSSLFMDNANWFTQQRLVRVKAYAVLLDKDGNTQVIYSDLVRIQL